MEDKTLQTEINMDSIRNLVKEGVIENVQSENECTDNMECPME